MKKETETVNPQALAPASANQMASFTPDEIKAVVPTSREQLEMLIELNALEKTVESLGEKTTKPTDLADSGVVFDILDCWFTEIRDGDEMKKVVCFQIQETDTGLNHIVMQGSGSVRDTYANYFGAFKAVGVPKRLANYRYVYSEKTYAAGNKAVILERVNAQAKAINV